MQGKETKSISTYLPVRRRWEAQLAATSKLARPPLGRERLASLTWLSKNPAPIRVGDAGYGDLPAVHCMCMVMELGGDDLNLKGEERPFAARELREAPLAECGPIVASPELMGLHD